MQKKQSKGIWKVGFQAAVAALGVVLLMLSVVGLATYVTPRLAEVSVGTAEGSAKDPAAVLATASVALAAATVTLTFFGFLVALLAIFGWRSIRERVDEEVARAMKDEREYDKAQGRLSQGTIFGLLTQYLTRIRPEMGEVDSRKFFLEDAIGFLQEALPGLHGEELEPDALNALAYSLSLRGSPQDASTAWNLVRDYEEFFRRKGLPPPFLLTKGAVVARFAADLPNLSAREITALRSAIDKTVITDGKRYREREKSIVLRELDEVLQKLPKKKPPPTHWERLQGLLKSLKSALRI